MINKVTLIGNIGKDPEVKRFENGNIVASFSVATSENYRDKSGEWQTQTEWHNIVAWGKWAERTEKALKKGLTVYIEGKNTTRTWEKDGQKKYRHEVVCSYFRVINKSNEPESKPATLTPATEAGSDDDDLPF